MRALSANSLVPGAGTFYQRVLVAVAIVTGLPFGNPLVPSRRQ
jgi:hypothetical protein